ncbi:MAG: hypothetical protein RL685_7725 [Pseudomonadota bacterium]|jgi:hypothetical protein
MGWGALLGLLWAGLGCTGASSATTPWTAAQVEDLPIPACLASAPIDLAAQVGEPPVASYVNDLRLGYARGGAIFLSRPLCELYGWSLCRFVELHEQAHLYMKTVGAKSTCAETLADCWAAMRSDSEALEAAKRYFQGRHEERTGHHADPEVRLEVIHHCANLPRRQLAEATASTVEAEPQTL